MPNLAVNASASSADRGAVPDVTARMLARSSRVRSERNTIRSALEGHPAVRGAAVVGRPDNRLGETPVAMVELRNAASVDTAALVEFLRARLAHYEIPNDIAIVDQIPRTPSGKADLGAVREFFSHPVEHAK